MPRLGFETTHGDLGHAVEKWIVAVVGKQFLLPFGLELVHSLCVFVACNLDTPPRSGRKSLILWEIIQRRESLYVRQFIYHCMVSPCQVSRWTFSTPPETVGSMSWRQGI